MEGKSHLLVGLTAAVVFDSFVHLSGDPITGGKAVTLGLLSSKAIYYFSVGVGALLPDIDNARSTMGRKLGVISKGIQALTGHRTFFHSLLGLVVCSGLAFGAGKLVVYLLGLRGIVPSDLFLDASVLVGLSVLFGCVMHIAADALTIGGVPLFWPIKQRFGFPPDDDWRFKTGTWPEHAVVWVFIILVAFFVWQGNLRI
jgi:inner membrane protein